MGASMKETRFPGQTIAAIKGNGADELAQPEKLPIGTASK
jgi:hypothetical protein